MSSVSALKCKLYISLRYDLAYYDVNYAYRESYNTIVSVDVTFPIKYTMHGLQQITSKKYINKMYASYIVVPVNTGINTGTPYASIFLKFTYMVSVNPIHMCIYCMWLYGCHVYVHNHDRSL